ncbi:MAG: 2-(1,2-epoxy-1,2-dihydrophenyl)acetyl-CoA isomerase [Flavobacteriales bacterium]|nr:2-(1,2-epoxy-1,2-dihydrophenyl)acetyl-CoA isomerase [Flavobacteriales bacterium]NNK80499.1 2-(1,2-epoxy-1,2-dihydrophenyl)acetyl-CoA isomerase [Flavobacteriales bacterium]
MEYIQFDIKGKVGHITLNRPDVLNSFCIPMGHEMRKALEQCRDDDQVRAIYITGAGRAFCAGQELQEAIDPEGPGIGTIVDETYNPIVTLIREILKPVICGVNGVAAGAGANIALACDVTFAIESAKFVQAFSSIGLVPDSGGTHTLPRLIGYQRAAALMYSGDKLSSKEAADMGMIYKCVADGGLDEAIEFAEKLAERPTKGIGLTKQLLNQSPVNTIFEQLSLERDLQIIAFETEDCKEGVNAFLEKRKPNYTGK